MLLYLYRVHVQRGTIYCLAARVTTTRDTPLVLFYSAPNGVNGINCVSLWNSKFIAAHEVLKLWLSLIKCTLDQIVLFVIFKVMLSCITDFLFVHFSVCGTYLK